ncbi:hypothetical protein MASR2M29_04510 [Spirochaetota bacterium]
MAKSKKKLLLPAVLFLGILVLGFGLSCSMEGQVYGRLTLALEVPQLPASKAGTGPVSSRFIHPAGATLSFKLYANNTLFNKQTIALDPDSPKPQTATLTIENVPYNKELRAEIRVYGETTPVQGDEELLGSNDIYIGYLKSGNKPITLGVKPVTYNTATYNDGENGIFLDFEDSPFSNIWNIEMYPEKGLYTIDTNTLPTFINIYDEDGKNYKNTFLLGTGMNSEETLVFYHPTNTTSNYYVYFTESFQYIGGSKLEQDILITTVDESENDVIVEPELDINFGLDDPISFTIYNPYPFTLTPKLNISGDDASSFSSQNFPSSLAPGEKKEFTVSCTEYGKSASAIISVDGLTSFSVTLKGPVT